MNTELSFLKGHGTENDFVILPDAGGVLELTEDLVRGLCDRRSGLGADGVIRVVRTDACDLKHSVSVRDEARWYMDHWNSDGSVADMCGNGIRLMAKYLADSADIDVREPLKIGTRSGVKAITFDGDEITVNMGQPQILGETKVTVGDQSWEAKHISMGNPHAVAFVDALDDAGPLTEAPGVDTSIFPDGANVEFVRRVADQHIEMRVHERGSGETKSCGTGACAVMLTTALADRAERGTSYRVDLPGGTLSILWNEGGEVEMTGPASIVAEGIVAIPANGH